MWYQGKDLGRFNNCNVLWNETHQLVWFKCLPADQRKPLTMATNHRCRTHVYSKVCYLIFKTLLVMESSTPLWINQNHKKIPPKLFLICFVFPNLIGKWDMFEKRNNYTSQNELQRKQLWWFQTLQLKSSPFL